MENQELPQTETPQTEAPQAEKPADQKLLLHFGERVNTLIAKLKKFTGSNAQLQRIIYNSAIHPMNQDELHFSYVEEKDIFDDLAAINSCKFYLMLLSLENSGKIKVLEPFDKEFEEQKETKNEQETA